MDTRKKVNIILIYLKRGTKENKEQIPSNSNEDKSKLDKGKKETLSESFIIKIESKQKGVVENFIKTKFLYKT